MKLWAVLRKVGSRRRRTTTTTPPATREALDASHRSASKNFRQRSLPKKKLLLQASISGVIKSYHRGLKFAELLQNSSQNSSLLIWQSHFSMSNLRSSADNGTLEICNELIKCQTTCNKVFRIAMKPNSEQKS